MSEDRLRSVNNITIAKKNKNQRKFKQKEKSNWNAEENNK